MVKKLTKADEKLRYELPFLFGWSWYTWAKKFFDSDNRFCFLVAANQISKSSTQIRKAIDWATNKKKWPHLWRNNPTQFWYFYPTKDIATSEFRDKWEVEFLPRGEMKSHPIYGWEAQYKAKDIFSIRFNSGVTIYFKTYEQDVKNLQASTVYAIFCDEELPFSYFQELRSRLAASNGYFSMVFTATLGQDEWRRTIEPANESEELFKDALKLQVSMYDCLRYIDGKPSHWTIERIKQIESECATEAEVNRRVYGRFVVSAGLKYPSFNRAHNAVKPFKIPDTWHIYTGVDIGSGGEKNHPAAIMLVAVRPDFKYGVVFRGWRGDGIVTTSADILAKHRELCNYGEKRLVPAVKSYDWHNKDFFNIASRAGEGFTPADKRRDRGENLLNTLFKLKMLDIFEEDPELSKLVVELSSLLQTTAKTKALDDACDALRYTVTAIPWNFEDATLVMSEVGAMKEEPEFVDTRSAAKVHWDERRSGPMPSNDEQADVDSLFQEWNSYLED